MFYTYVGRKGNVLHHIGYDAKGKRFHNEVDFKPSIYYEGAGNDSVSIYGKPLKQRKFDSLSDWAKFYYANKDILEMYGDVDPAYQFVSQKYDKVEYSQEFIRMWFLDIEVLSNEGFPFPYEAKHPIVSIAIYDNRRDEYIILGLKDWQYDPKRITFNTDKIKFKKCDSEEDLLTKFIELNEALHPDIWIAHNGESFDYPYIINRINNIGMEANKLSPFGRAHTKYTEVEDKFMSKKSEYFNKIDGISLLDNLNLYKKYIQTPRESFSLSNLAIEDLGLDKINYDEYDNLSNLYEQNYEKFIDYNINDVYLMYLLNKKNGYLSIHIRNAYKAKLINFEEAMSPVKLWDIYIYHELQKKNIQVPPFKENIEKFSYPGAFVVPPIIRPLKWVVSFDLASLYPHIQMQWHISPETLIEGLMVHQWLHSLTDHEIDLLIEKANSPEQAKFLNDLKEMNNLGYTIDRINVDELDERILNGLIPDHPDYIMSANGFYFKKEDMGIIPALLFENYDERKDTKTEMAKIKAKKQSSEAITNKLASMKVSEKGIKIMMNAEYGALANEYFRYCKYELCSSVTMCGQLVLKTLIKAINLKYSDIEIAAGDTDSIYLVLEKVVEKNCSGMSEPDIITWVDRFCDNDLQKTIGETFEKLAVMVGAPKNFMKMAREKLISDAFWTAKKHYAYRMVMEEDVLLDKPKFGYKGLECVKSSIPRLIRDEQKKVINTILSNPKEIEAMIAESKKKIMGLMPEQIAFPKTCNGIHKYSDSLGNPIKGAQAHVKAALAYNKYIKEKKLENQYPLIRNGDKIRFVWLKTPNVFNSETFGFINRLPKDDLILEFIDYKTIYEKSFEKVIMDILDRLGLSGFNSKTNSLEDLF